MSENGSFRTHISSCHYWGRAVSGRVAARIQTSTAHRSLEVNLDRPEHAARSFQVSRDQSLRHILRSQSIRYTPVATNLDIISEMLAAYFEALIYRKFIFILATMMVKNKFQCD
eukprot:scaffold81293_cov21-Prasinocladus_malaysianus.AAC.1